MLGGSSADGWALRRPPAISAIAIAATANEAASITKAGPVPTIAMKAPATAGPMRPMTCIELCTTAFAGASWRSGTSIGTIVFIAG